MMEQNVQSASTDEYSPEDLRRIQLEAARKIGQNEMRQRMILEGKKRKDAELAIAQEEEDKAAAEAQKKEQRRSPKKRRRRVLPRK